MCERGRGWHICVWVCGLATHSLGPKSPTNTPLSSLNGLDPQSTSRQSVVTLVWRCSHTSLGPVHMYEAVCSNLALYLYSGLSYILGHWKWSFWMKIFGLAVVLMSESFADVSRWIGSVLLLISERIKPTSKSIDGKETITAADKASKVSSRKTLWGASHVHALIIKPGVE